MIAPAKAPFELRRARADEGEAILPCYEWLFTPPGSRPPNWRRRDALERLDRTLANPEAAVFLAESTAGTDRSAPVVGLCSTYIDIESVRYGLRGWIEDLAVAPEQRSAGIGAALLRVAREWARERGATHLELDSGIRRHDAHRFYERQSPAWTGIQYAWQL